MTNRQLLAVPHQVAAVAPGSVVAYTPAGPSSPRIGRFAACSALSAVLAGVVPLLLLAEVGDVGRSVGWRWTFALTVWAGVRLAHRIVDGRPMLFDFIFWLFTYIFMGLAPTAQLRSGEISRTTPGMNPDLDQPTAIAVWGGVLMYELGRLVAGRRSRDRAARGRVVRPPRRQSVISGRRALVLAAIGLLAAAYYVNKVGVSTLFMSRYSSFAIRSAALPDLAIRSIVMAAASYPLLIAVGALLRLRGVATGKARDGYLLAVAAVLPVLLLVVNPISSARYDFGTVGFGLIIMAGAMATVRRSRLTMAATVLAFLYVFPLADAFRSDVPNFERGGFFDEYLGNPDYDAFWQVANTIALIHEHGLAIGNQLLGVLLFWVPRGLWAAKPVDTGVLLANYRGYSFDNLSAPLWSEMLVNGGPVLLVTGFLAAGWGLGRLDARIAGGLLNHGQFWAVVGAVFPFYMVILLRGSLLQATGTLVVALACVLAIRRRDSVDDLRGGGGPVQSEEPFGYEVHAEQLTSRG